MNILGIDPGVMTGYCYGVLEDKQLKLRPIQVVDEVDDCWRRIEAFGPRYIIIENFEFRQKSRTGLNLFPVQLIGVVRLWGLTGQQSHVQLQSASQGKAYYTDKLLKSNGWHKAGVPHGTDAMRHLLHWFTFGAGYQFNTKDTVISLD